MNITSGQRPLSQDDIFTAIRNYLKTTTCYDDEHIRRAYIDNVGAPADYPYVYITITGYKRSATNEKSYSGAQSKQTISTSIILDVQLDFYGTDSIDEARAITQIFRDAYSVDFFEDYGVSPLYCDDIISVGEQDENDNWKVRNTFSLHFNLHPQVVLSQDFFDEIKIQSKRTDGQTIDTSEVSD